VKSKGICFSRPSKCLGDRPANPLNRKERDRIRHPESCGLPPAFSLYMSKVTPVTALVGSVNII
jgi:hypothetical protein